jgi:SAM-dependent methyltransferase
MPRIGAMAKIEDLIGELADSERLGEWRKAVFRTPSGKVTAEPVEVKRGPAVKLVRREGARELTQAIPPPDWPAQTKLLLDDADRIHVMSAAGDWHARRTKRGRWLVSRGKAPASGPRSAPALAPHDREKAHPLPPDDPHVRSLLVATGLFSPHGNLRGAGAGKYRQVQHYVELLRPLPIWEAARRERRPVRIVDGGCGKAYMSLALYAYARLRGLEVDLLGIDSNPEVVESVRRIAAELGYERARFEAATIEEAAGRPGAGAVDLLVSLHACDTATDEALAAGVRLDAQAIVLAPCCHHELAAQLSDGEVWDGVLRHGVLRGRLADVVTDALRAQALEVFGYRADVIEFVAAEHTAKNLMIRAVRPRGSRRRRDAARSFAALTNAFGVDPAVKRLLADRWPPPAPS